LCFGDSITFGYAVGDRETYSYFLEQYLGPERVEVVNCGVTGYTSHQVARWLGQLHPQLPCRVVMFCVGWNDFSVRPTDDLHYARQVRIAMTGRAMAKYSRIYRLLRNSYVKSSFAADGPPSLTHRVPPDQYQRNIQAIVSECRSRGAAPIAVDLPCRKGGEASHRDRYSAALRAACAKLDVPVLDIGALAPGFSNEEYFIDSCHFSVAGHQHLAKRIADALVGLGLVEKP
jgi:lysophospholipase L1-like esterase